MNTLNTNQRFSLLSKMGYNGPANEKGMSEFLQSNPGAAARMGKFDRALKRGFAVGGTVVQPVQENAVVSPEIIEPVTSGPVVSKEETPQPIMETTQVYTQSPSDQVSQMYQDILGRPADKAGLDFYTNKVASGEMTTDQVMEALKKAATESSSTGGSMTGPAGDPAVDTALERVQTTGKQGVDWWTEQVSLREKDVKYWQDQVNKLTDSGDEASLQKAQEELAKADSASQDALKGLQSANQDLAVDDARLRAALPNTSQILAQSLSDPASLLTQGTPSKLTVGEGQLVDQSAGIPTAPVGTAGFTSAGTAAQATTPDFKPAATMDATKATPDVDRVLSGVEAAQGTVAPEAQVTAEEQTTSSVSDLQAAQGQAYLMDNPVQREIEAGELVSGSAVDAAKVEALNAQLYAAQATPSKQATVQGQLEGLMQQFEGGNTPAWAAGAMRNANAILAQRGLGASSMAGQAVIQAAMEAALPIAQADAATRASFESQNLSNRQQVAMFAAQQRASFLQQEFDQEFQTRVQNASRIADIANMNFTAEQQIALENSRAVNTMNLANLSNRQGMIMAEAAALANLDIANLNNRQQAAVQNAQNFLQMDLANLSNQQQTSIFQAQQRVTALLSDQAAENAAAQFNAASENQTNQFFADLQSTVSRFNADQVNAINQFNAGEANATARFNASLQEQRQQFEANNRLIIAQANAKWRQDIATMNTAAENEFLMESVKQANGLTTAAIDNLWQRERDLMNFAFAGSESYQDRTLSILLADKDLQAMREKMDNENDQMFGAGVFQLVKEFVVG